MKLKKVGAICAAEEAFILVDEKGEQGDVVRQWLGSGDAFYPLDGMPMMEMENVCAMYDITAEKAKKILLKHKEAPKDVRLEDADPEERLLDEPKLCIRYDGMVVIPLETTKGIAFIQEKHLSPLGKSDYIQLFERKGTSAGMYIAAKVGMLLQAVIMPVDIVDEKFMRVMDALHWECRVVLAEKRRMEEEQRMEELMGQEELHRVDESTGEVIDFPAGKEKET